MDFGDLAAEVKGALGTPPPAPMPAAAGVPPSGGTFGDLSAEINSALKSPAQASVPAKAPADMELYHDHFDPLAASAGVAPQSTPLASNIFNGPSWADQALAQSQRDREAYARGGVREMLRDTEGTQDLAGGFAGSAVPEGGP